MFSVNVNATDNVGIREVRVTKDGGLACILNTVPYQCQLKINGNRNRAMTIEATAIDTSGNEARNAIQVYMQ